MTVETAFSEDASWSSAAPALGWDAAIAAYGAFLLLLFGSSLSTCGSADTALYTLGAFYLANAVLCFWFFASSSAERPC